MSLHEHFSSERAWRKGPGIPAGADAERALLGEPAIPRREDRNEYMPFSQAVELVKKHQPKILERSAFVSDLRSRIAKLCNDVETPVRFFTAVGTPLDTYHGVDAFFEQGGRIATIDVSLRTKEGHKADVLVIAMLDEEGNVTIDEKEVVLAAQKIAEHLNQRPERRAA